VASRILTGPGRRAMKKEEAQKPKDCKHQPPFTFKFPLLSGWGARVEGKGHALAPRPGNPFQGPGGEALRLAKKRLFFHGWELHFCRFRRSISLFWLSFCGGKVGVGEQGLSHLLPVLSASPPGPGISLRLHERK